MTKTEIEKTLEDIVARVESYIHTESHEFLIGKLLMLQNKIQTKDNIEAALEVGIIALYTGHKELKDEQE